jgi:hypothetical protein
MKSTTTGCGLNRTALKNAVDRRFVIIESANDPCNVGFAVDKDNGCPLFGFKPSVNNIDELLAIIKRVVAFRKAQAAEKRQSAA